MFAHDMTSIRTKGYSLVRWRLASILVLLVGSGGIGVFTLATRADEGEQPHAPQPIAVVPGDAAKYVWPVAKGLLPAQLRELSRPNDRLALRYLDADGATHHSEVIPLSPEPEFTGKLRLEPKARVPQPIVEPIPPWIIGDPAFQLIPKYEPGSAVAIFVAPSAPAAER